MSTPLDDDAIGYARWLTHRLELLVVDGSEAEIFADHRRRLGGDAVHIPPDADLNGCANGKVAGVVTGIRHASCERIVIADEDVRYGEQELAEVVRALDAADIVRPQNYFSPLPWHATLDTARTLLNRISGGDWPGTLAVRRSRLIATNGYDGDVMFENLELVRTVRAAGGVEAVLPGVYVRRLPPNTIHFWSQRIRQAYDELARPFRLVLWLGILPAIAIAIAAGKSKTLLLAAAIAIGAAEAGRRRAGGRRVFPARAALCAPAWILERGICAWLAVGSHLLLGGIPYRGRIVRRAATPLRDLRARLSRVG
jgi:hypothetical protein